MVALLTGCMLSGCGLKFFERWDGEAVRVRATAGSAEDVWERIAGGTGDVDLRVSQVRPQQRMLQFDWVTAPGDGELYLVCQDSPIGSASLRPRVEVRPTNNGGSTVVVSTEVRATTSTVCRSNGRFEEWLLQRLEPAITAASETATPATDQPSSPND